MTRKSVREKAPTNWRSCILKFSFPNIICNFFLKNRGKCLERGGGEWGGGGGKAIGHERVPEESGSSISHG